MLCTYCGATSAPTLDRCVVCHTPFPPGVLEPAETSPGTGPDLDETRLGDETHLAGPTDPKLASPPSVSHVGGVPVLEVGHTFAGRYTIIRLLGAGGMAAVYQAWDETLRTAVALKLIRVDPSMRPTDIQLLEERFKRELKLARQVTHPNVVRIHDLGEVGRTLYLTMAYVQGSDLATILQRDGRLELARVLSLAKQVVSGLAAAHRAGVVHRDLKPANIMVDAEDQALLTDFGIARSTSSEQALRPDIGISLPSSGSTLHTMPGAIMGTLEYMAPEQARGEPADARTDVYAFGLILYELLAGGRPRARAGDLAQLLARIQQGPPPIKTVLPDLPDGVERIVTKCLKPEPEARYATADELYADLARLDDKGKPIPTLKRIPRWKVLTSAAVISAVLVTATWWAASTRQPPEARPPLPVLIVDFENRAQEAVFDGALEQALSIAMEGAPFITAFPRRDAANLVRVLKLGDKLDEKAGRLVATREGIPVILAGSIEREGSGYRIAVRAVDSTKPDPPLADARARASDKGAVLAAVGKVAEEVREALGDTEPSSQQQAETFTASSIDAIREYTIAQDLSADQKDEEAVGHYKQALAHDGEFGRAYAGLAMSLHYLGRDEKEVDKEWQDALKRTDRMTERERLRTSGLYYAANRNYDMAIDTFKELISKYQADSAGYNNIAVAYFGALNFASALEHGRKAIEIYPKSFKYRSNFALYAMYAGDFKTAAATAQQLVKENPSFEMAYLPLAMEALASGDANRARIAYEQASKSGDAGVSLSAIGLADLAIYQGRYDDAASLLPAAIKHDIDQKNSFAAVAKLLALAEAHAARGQQAARQAALDQAAALADDDNVLVTAARLSLSAGQVKPAKAIAAKLGQRLPAQSRAYGKLIEGEIALAAKQYPEALDALNAARKLADLWLVRYVSGLAYFERGQYLEASAEFTKCQERRGEATAVFLDDLPTFRYYVPVPYWAGRAREMRGLDPKTQYQEFVAIRSAADNDPLVADAKRRLAALTK